MMLVFLFLWYFKTTFNLQQLVLGSVKITVWLRKQGKVVGKGFLLLPPSLSYLLQLT